MNKIASIYTYIFVMMFLFSSTINAQNQFKVVLDAGHGGKDSGAYKNKIKEKDIVLDVVLRIGKILDKHSDIKQIYTRKTDVFIPLKERADIANKADANLFISVHCNSSTSALPYGTLTLVMGQGRSDMNFEVAKVENSVIFLEDDYKADYKGFDPNKPESVIGLKILQEESLNRSVEVASDLQVAFEKELGRKNKGVHQQLLWVLDATYMPGVLVELGFISNATEAKYLSSEKGKQEMAEAIAKVIITYKNDYFSTATAVQEPLKTDDKSKTTIAQKNDEDAPNRFIPRDKPKMAQKNDEKTAEKIGKPEKINPKKDTTIVAKIVEKPKEITKEELKKNDKTIVVPKIEPQKTEKPIENKIDDTKKVEPLIATKVNSATENIVIYKVQISATDKKFDLKPEFFKGLDKISVTYIEKLYRYYYEEATEYTQAQKYLEIARKKGYTSAFIVPFKNGEKITFQEAFNHKK